MATDPIMAESTTPFVPFIPTMLSRRRPKPTGDEEAAATLRLGPEFEHAPALSVSEANVLLKKVMYIRQQPNEHGRQPPVPPNTDVYIKTRDYLETFARFKEESSAQQAEMVSSKLTDEGRVSSFERAQICELAPLAQWCSHVHGTMLTIVMVQALFAATVLRKPGRSSRHLRGKFRMPI